ncbi:MAG: hypothetical protein KBT28_01500 [Bacteroidales bacterium]|nr:hypothetical protein [Candidatus Colimorpha merdihippi]
MSEQLHEWCLELLTNATGERLPDGHSVKEEEYKWHGFASHGYRNNDVVNSMIAFFYEHGEIPTDSKPWWASSRNKEAVKEYMEWAREHMDEEDWLDVDTKARGVIPYIVIYREHPEWYLIQCDYLPGSLLATF